MKLDPQFKEFLSAIRPTDAQKEDYQNGYKTLRRRLEEDEALSPLIISTFLQGSIRRATAVRPVNDKRPDVDLVVATNLDRNAVTPRDAIDKFVPFVKAWYPDKFKIQGRSIAIELSYVDLDIVVTAVPADEDSARYRWRSVTTAQTLEEAKDWRLVEPWRPEAETPAHLLDIAKARIAAADEWKAKPLWIPDRDVGAWQQTHPLLQIEWTAEKNGRCNGHYVNVVKAVKWMRHLDEKMPKYPKGYPVEHLIGVCCPDGILSVADGVTLTLEAIASNYALHAAAKQTPKLPDHGVPAHDVMKRVDGESFAKFHARIAEAAKIAREALESEDPMESASAWQKLFGSKFPDPPTRGGDRGGGNRGGFKERAAVSVPATAPRFA